VKEIYAEEFQLSGRVLDVGGHQGRLRHFLSPAETRCYISVDPVLDIFRTADRPNLLQAYPCLSTACNFVCSHAEALPFVAGQFDWVHMRSVLDHFSDPYLALREAYRVVRPGGQVLIGLTIMERMVHARPAFSERVKRKLRDEGPLALVRAATRRLGRGSAGEPDDHNFRLTHSQLLDLIARTGFRVTREHWQKPPFRHVIYVSGTKPGAR
jgi:ubiquinone/menaquinone biosynthesis C-methylase UbiE